MVVAFGGWMPEEREGCYIFYRIVATDPPTARDFLPAEALGRGISRRATEEQLHSWRHCVSVFQSAEQARETEYMMRALRPPRPIGDYIAQLWIPTDSNEIIWRATPPEGHFDLEGDPAVLLRCVHSVRAL